MYPMYCNGRLSVKKRNKFRKRTALLHRRTVPSDPLPVIIPSQAVSVLPVSINLAVFMEAPVTSKQHL